MPVKPHSPKAHLQKIAHKNHACGPACYIRINRIHSLLSSNRPTNAEALARELEVSARTIKRDIDLTASAP